MYIHIYKYKYKCVCVFVYKGSLHTCSNGPDATAVGTFAGFSSCSDLRSLPGTRTMIDVWLLLAENQAAL